MTVWLGHNESAKTSEISITWTRLVSCVPLGPRLLDEGWSDGPLDRSTQYLFISTLSVSHHQNGSNMKTVTLFILFIVLFPVYRAVFGDMNKREKVMKIPLRTPLYPNSFLQSSLLLKFWYGPSSSNFIPSHVYIWIYIY